MNVSSELFENSFLYLVCCRKFPVSTLLFIIIICIGISREILLLYISNNFVETFVYGVVTSI